MCILGNMHGCFYGLWSKNNEYRVTIEIVQKIRYIKKKIRKKTSGLMSYGKYWKAAGTK
jgi:hypothetical protein